MDIMRKEKVQRNRIEEKDDNDDSDNFQSVYKRVVVKNRILNEKTNSKNAFLEMLEISRVNDYNIMMKYEYILKLCFFSSNVNVLNVYRLVKSEYEKEFDEVAAYLRSNILISIMDTNQINDKSEHVGEYFIKNYEQLKNFEYIIGNTDYPLGFEKNTNGIFRVYLFKIIPSRTLLLNETNLDYIKNGEIPNNYDSIAVDRELYYEQMGSLNLKPGGKENETIRSGYTKGGNKSNNTKTGTNYSYIYKVKSAEQVLPLLLIEFEFKCLRVDISVPICEYCYTTKAIYYCHNDKVHLCDVCDIKHHEKNRILKNHKRIHISESPYQFGKCAYHPNELVESICMKCYCSLCSNCLLIGSHSRSNCRNHPIVNIKDAFILSNKKKSLSDINLENRKIRILNLLKKKHKLLAEIYSNYTSLQKRIDTLYKYIIDELKVLKKKKMQFLMALKRAVLSQLLIIEWTEAFFFHTKLSLNLSDFILYQKKHELVIQFLMANNWKDLNLIKHAPYWLFQKIFVKSNLCIYEDNFFKLNFISPKDLESGIPKNNLVKKGCILKANENRLEDMYNFNNVLNDKKGYLGLYDETNFEEESQEGGEEENEEEEKKKNKNQTSVKYSGIGSNDVDELSKEIRTNQWKNISFNLRHTKEIEDTGELSTHEIQNILTLNKDYSSLYDLTEDKPTNSNLLCGLFRDEHELKNLQDRKTPLKQSHMYKELWKHLVNYKYINVIHILKAKCSLNTLLLTYSFFNVSNYYDCMEDIVKHIIKHEIYTLLNKNIDYHTKMKVTQVLDNVATLLCLRRFKLAPLIDKYIELCFSKIEKEEKEILSYTRQKQKKDEHVYENSYKQIEKNLTSVELSFGKVESSNNMHNENVPLMMLKKEQNGYCKIEKDKEKSTSIESNEKKGAISRGVNNILEVDQTVLEEDNTIIEDINTKLDEKEFVNMNNLNDADDDVLCLNIDEKKEFSILKKINEYIYIYLEMLINDLVNIPHKDLNDGIRLIFYLIHDEIDGMNKNLMMNEKKYSIHTLSLCLDLFLNSVLYPYIFYVHEENVNAQIRTNYMLYQKVVIMFGQILREISIYIFQIYNLGMYDNNLKAFINNIKDNKILLDKATNEKMFFLDVSQKLFKWIIKNLESPRFYSPMKWNSSETVEKSYERIINEIVSIDKSSANNCINENVDYNVLFSTSNFKEILSLCYSIQNSCT
ncbi:hypothetical protein, conserved [Plasmodium gonderi]|uniref:B box-type domain-containing protein n=1 Tax=Plasmodium gonderi TaxID=77519 RepID=A0A1Y1JPD9_PLAGO|nr:hypothetical protein, conserved [Plasmodium gonderi]GAW82682.1 hypothetical protein, conserved [Plasmodium gonderi]